MTGTGTREIMPDRDGDELAHQPRLALLTLGLGLLAPMALFSSTWVGFGLGVLAVAEPTDSPETASVLAVLDATNRWVSRI